MKVKKIRILEYEGDIDRIEYTLAHGGVPANGVYNAPNMTIRSAVLEYPQFIQENSDEDS